MAKYGEWTQKGAVLSDKTARKEYGIDQDFIIAGIREGKLEFRQGVIFGNPYLRLLRRQLEQYISEKRGSDHLLKEKNKTELRKIKREISSLKKRLRELEIQREQLENT